MIRALCLTAICLEVFTAAAAAAPAPPQVPRFRHLGMRWIGLSRVACQAPTGWRAEPLFLGPYVPPGGAELCVYTWTGVGLPTPADVGVMFAGNGHATDMAEDVPVLVPMDSRPPWTSAELSFFAGLRSAVRQHVGSASLLPTWPAQPAARIVVIDSAPTAPHGAIRVGAGSRHGDNLAHLIEDLVCLPSLNRRSRLCAAEVTTELALPWRSAGVMGSDGGTTGTLVDLTRAIHQATVRWELERLSAQTTTPPKLILNLSLGWEHTEDIADCSRDPGGPFTVIGLPAWAVQLALQYAASRDVLIIAAAGNDSGGTSPRTGPSCPGNYQSLPQQGRPWLPVLTAVSGVDYGDRPLESARPLGHTRLVGLGLGGVAWAGSDLAPPALVGSSVAAAVVSAVSAVTWAFRPTWEASEIIGAVHGGGVHTGITADACPDLLGSCATRRATVCGALSAAGATFHCSSAPARPSSSPHLPSEIATLSAAFPVEPIDATLVLPPLTDVPRYLLPSMQVEPWTFPTPISATCPTCVVGASSTSATQWQVLLPTVGRTLLAPMLVLRFDGGSIQGVALGPSLIAGVSYRFSSPSLSELDDINAAYLTGFDEQQEYSVTEQLFVAR